jgi:hypothetical protein
VSLNVFDTFLGDPARPDVPPKHYTKARDSGFLDKIKVQGQNCSHRVELSLRELEELVGRRGFLRVWLVAYERPITGELPLVSSAN